MKSAMSATSTPTNFRSRLLAKFSQCRSRKLKRPTQCLLTVLTLDPTDSDFSWSFHAVSYLFACRCQGNSTTYLTPRGTIPLNTEV